METLFSFETDYDMNTFICRIATSFCRQAENLKKSKQENFCLFPIMHKAKGS